MFRVRPSNFLFSASERKRTHQSTTTPLMNIRSCEFNANKAMSGDTRQTSLILFFLLYRPSLRCTICLVSMKPCTVQLLTKIITSLIRPLDQSQQLTRHTPCCEKRHSTFCHNLVKCRPILEVLLLVATQRNSRVSI